MACYYPNGQVAEGLQPCNTTAGAVSSCCRVGDVCLTNGFCFSAGQNSLVRRGCTDKTFNSTECPHNCLAGQGSSVDVVMTPCGDYTYFCCGQDAAARNCCTSGNGTVLLAAGTAILPTATITYNNTITATSACTAFPSTSTPAATVSNNCDSPGGVSTGAVAGLGGALGLAALTAALFLVLWRMKAQRVKHLEQREKDLMQQVTDLEPSVLMSQ